MVDEESEGDKDSMPLVQNNCEELGKGDLEEEEDPINCIPDQDSVEKIFFPKADDNNNSIPDFVPEPEGRPSRNVGPPKMYDPSSGRSYAQLVESHNLVKSEESVCTLKYEEVETKVVANLIAPYSKQFNGQHLMLKKGLKKFPSEGKPAAKKEINQMHERKCFKAIAVSELTRREQEKSMEGLMFLKRKSPGVVKGWLVYNGKMTRVCITNHDESILTVLTEIILPTVAVDAHEH